MTRIFGPPRLVVRQRIAVHGFLRSAVNRQVSLFVAFNTKRCYMRRFSDYVFDKATRYALRPKRCNLTGVYRSNTRDSHGSVSYST